MSAHTDFPELDQTWPETYGSTEKSKKETSGGYRIGMVVLWTLVALAVAAVIAIGVFKVGVRQPDVSAQPVAASTASAQEQRTHGPPGAAVVPSDPSPAKAPHSPLLDTQRPQAGPSVPSGPQRRTLAPPRSLPSRPPTRGR